MTRRGAWIIGGALAVLLVAGAAAWLWQSSREPSIVESPSSQSSPTPKPTQASADEVQALIEEHLEKCATSTKSTPPEGCGIRIPWGTEFSAVSGIRYRIDKPPTAEIEADRFIAKGGVLVATVTGTGQDGTPRTETYRNENWGVRGDIDVTDEGVEISVW